MDITTTAATTATTATLQPLPPRPGYSSMTLILNSNLEIVAREKDHLHAKSLALEMGHTLVEECQPERRRWEYINGCWQRVC